MENNEQFANQVLDVVANSEFGKFCQFLMGELQAPAQADAQAQVSPVPAQEAPQAAEVPQKAVEDAERRKYSRLETENAALKQRLDALEQDSKKIKIESELKSLEAENIKFDFADEFKRMLSLPNPMEHAEIMRKNYSRNVTGVNLASKYSPKIPEKKIEPTDWEGVMDTFEYAKPGNITIPSDTMVREYQSKGGK